MIVITGVVGSEVTLGEIFSTLAQFLTQHANFFYAAS